MNEDLPAISGLISKCDLASTFEFDGFPVRVLTNSPALKSELEQYYAVFRTDVNDRAHVVFAFDGAVPEFSRNDWQIKQPEPGKHRIKEHFQWFGTSMVVRKVQTGVHLAWLPEGVIAFGPLTDNPNQVVNFINNLYLDDLLSEDGQLFHAAGVCTGGGRGLGLAGQSGKGKSTLALKLLEAGLDFVSNDRLVVTDRGGQLHMQGVPKYPRINPGTIVNQASLLRLASPQDIERYRAMPADDLWELEEKYDAIVDEYFDGCQFRLGAAMSAFVLIDWDRHAEAPARLEAVSAGDVAGLIPAVMKSPGIMLPRASARIPAAQTADYRELLEQTRLYVLSGGVDFAAAAALIRAELEA